MNQELIIVLDMGVKNNQLIARVIRDLNVYCEVLPGDSPIERIREKSPAGIILTGEKPFIPEKDILTLDVPFLKVENNDSDETLKAIKKFLFKTCRCKGDWRPADFADKMVAQLKEKIGGKKVLCALSGGVDSTVAAYMVYKAAGDNLTCIFVDHGLMRKNEGDEVCAMFKDSKMSLIRVNAQERFLSKLEGVTDTELKRKIIGEEFIRVFEEEGKKIGAVDFLVQGTIYPDIIESGTDKAKLVKSHHNVGGLPDIVEFNEILEPLKDLFKNEVRAVGLALGLPDSFVYRQPFPGPGLGIRCIGEITNEKLDILREADFIFRDEIKKAGLDKDIWQYFAIITGIRSVGVKNDTRVYGHTIALRAINTIDAMTAEWAKIPYDVLEKASCRIVSEIESVVRVVYDVTNKPTSTIEWE